MLSNCSVVGDAMRRAIMLRFMLYGAVSWLILSSTARVRADEAEDKAVAVVEELGGRVTRDEKAPGKPVVTVGIPTGREKRAPRHKSGGKFLSCPAVARRIDLGGHPCC